MSAFFLTRRAAILGASAAAFGPHPAGAQSIHGPGEAALGGQRFYFAFALLTTGEGRIAQLFWPSQTWTPGGRAHERPFRVASISKLFTAFGAAILIADGRLSLDADIADILGPAFRHPAFPDRKITPRSLMCHTSGLRNGHDFPVPAAQSLTERLARAAQEPGYAGWFAPPHTPPGWFSYSDTNAAVLAQVIEAVSRQRFDLFMTEHVFARAAPAAEGYNWSGVPQTTRDQAMAGVRYTDNGWRAQVDADVPAFPTVSLYTGEAGPAPDPNALPLAQNGFTFSPHGGLRASLDDLAGLGILHAHTGATGSFATLAQAYRLMEETGWTYDPLNPNGDTENGFYQSYGLGLQRLTGVSGPGYGDALFGEQSHEWMGHGGDAYGWITGLWWNTQTQAVLTYAINGVPETGRITGQRSAFLAAEEQLADEAVQVLNAISD
jgi:CubicO group peptidase (beta-lactamase class C family)